MYKMRFFLPFKFEISCVHLFINAQDVLPHPMKPMKNQGLAASIACCLRYPTLNSPQPAPAFKTSCTCGPPNTIVLATNLGIWEHQWLLGTTTTTI